MQTLEVMAAHGEGFNDLNPNAVALVNQYYNNDLYRDRLEADLFQLTESEQSRLQTEQIAELVMAGAGLGTAAVKSGPGIVSWVKGLLGVKSNNSAGITQSHLTEMAKNGVKFTQENILATTRTPSGQIVFLERGNSSSGLQHIFERHAIDFAN